MDIELQKDSFIRFMASPFGSRLKLYEYLILMAMVKRNNGFNTE